MILDLLRRWAEESPDETFVVTESGSYSFARIWDLSMRQATRVRNAGVEPGDHVALIAGNSAAYLVAWFGINAAGAVAVTLNDQLLSDAVAYTVRQCDAKLIVADETWIETRLQYLDEERRALPRIVIGSEADFFRELMAVEPGQPDHRSESDICTILYTSGTTGLPKGVLCAHGGHLAVGRKTAELLALGRADRTMLFLPLYHTNPQMYGVMSALTVGCSLAIRPKFSAQRFFADARDFGATGCTFVGTVLTILEARYGETEKAHSLRYAIGGGTTADLACTIRDRFGFQVHELYGMTETGGWVSGNSVADMRIGSNGKVRDDVEVRIFDGDDRELAAGERGEIVVRPRRPNVILMGYYNKAEQMMASCRNLWFHTGDIGSFDGDGYLYFHGRSKELIRRGGEMISPIEIELVLMKMPGVSDCAIVGVPDQIMGEEIKAVVVPHGSLDPASVRDYLARHIPPSMLPRYVEALDVIPRTQTEKILRRELAYVDGNVADLSSRRVLKA
jgi:crotonobetaine/carnitine-CoA ligase